MPTRAAIQRTQRPIAITPAFYPRHGPILGSGKVPLFRRVLDDLEHVDGNLLEGVARNQHQVRRDLPHDLHQVRARYEQQLAGAFVTLTQIHRGSFEKVEVACSRRG